MPFRFDQLVLIILLALPVSAMPHGDKPHSSAEPENQPASAQQAPATGNESATTSSADSPAPSASAAKPGEPAEVMPMSFGAVFADLTLSDFPTLHPMVVHVPVTFIPVALLFSIISLFSARRQFVWLAFGFASAGLVGGLVAAFPLHPHTAGLSAAAQLSLQKHDFFAYTTIWLALASVALAVISVWKPTIVVRICLTAMLLFSTIAVAITGHYGGTLAYMHGVGVQGQFLSDH